MDNTGTSIVYKAYCLEPAITPAPGQTNGENKYTGNEREEDICVDSGSLGNGAHCNGCHHDTKRQVVYEFGVISVIVIHPQESILSKDTTFGINTEAKANNKERQGGHSNYQGCLK